MDFPLTTLAGLSEALLAFYATPTRQSGLEAITSSLRGIFGADVVIASTSIASGGTPAAEKSFAAGACLVVPIEGTSWQLTLHRAETFSSSERLLAQMFSEHLARVLRDDSGAHPQPVPRTAAGLSWHASELGLTAREAEVLRWIAAGKRDAQIATLIGAARRTVGKHVENILRKLGAETRLGAALIAEERLAKRLHSSTANPRKQRPAARRRNER
jgi:DNA-binding CsgD family transcriptional regulator